MLVLSRKRNEKIVIRIPERAIPGTEIVVSVADIHGNRIRLAIDAPEEYSIDRRGGENDHDCEPD